jgi:CO dehydrogenase maturation factor
MGRGEGQGCYCAVNHNLREVIDGMSRHYAYVVIDNEAGMEHLSRRTTRDVQHLIIVSDPTQRGLVAAQRIADMRKELDINIENAYLVVNRVQGKLRPELKAFTDKLDMPILGTIPADDELADFEFSGKPLIELGNESPVYQAVEEIMAQVLK